MYLIAENKVKAWQRICRFYQCILDIEQTSPHWPSSRFSLDEKGITTEAGDRFQLQSRTNTTTPGAVYRYTKCTPYSVHVFVPGMVCRTKLLPASFAISFSHCLYSFWPCIFQRSDTNRSLLGSIVSWLSGNSSYHRMCHKVQAHLETRGPLLNSTVLLSAV